MGYMRNVRMLFVSLGVLLMNTVVVMCGCNSDSSSGGSSYPVESPWLSAGGYQSEFDKHLANGAYPREVRGRTNAGSSQYSGIFEKATCGFASCHGIDLAEYKKRNDLYTARGFHQIWIQTFVDQGGITRYQATWINQDTAIGTPPPSFGG